MKIFKLTFNEIARYLSFCLEATGLMKPMRILPPIGEHVSKSK